MTPDLDLPDFFNRRKQKETPRVPETAVIDHKDKILPDLTRTPQDTSNGPDRDQFLISIGHHAKLKEAEKAAKTATKKFRQYLTNNGFNLKAFDLAIEEMDKEDGTTLDNLRDLKRYFEFLDLPIGHQFSFLDSASPAVKPPADVMAQAFLEGRERGLMGQNPDDQKWLPMTPEGQEHLRGWNDGQAVLMAKFRDIETGMTEAEKAEKKEAEAKAAKKAAKAAKAAEPKKGRGKKDAAETETEAPANEPAEGKAAVH